MPKFVIEREIPGLGALNAEEMQVVADKSNSVLGELSGEVQWVHSYVTDDKMYCVYIAPDEGGVREHAERGGFPADSVLEVHSTVDPTTAEVRVA